MKKQKREYPEEFKEQAINLLRTTVRSASDIERELGLTQGLLSRWNRKKAAADGTPIAPRAKQMQRYKVTTKQKDGRQAAPNHL